MISVIGPFIFIAFAAIVLVSARNEKAGNLAFYVLIASVAAIVIIGILMVFGPIETPFSTTNSSCAGELAELPLQPRFLKCLLNSEFRRRTSSPIDFHRENLYDASSRNIIAGEHL